MSASEPDVLGVRVDFSAGAIAARLRRGEGRGGALARAVGVKPGRAPAVVDATAGLGRDALLLASLGCEVTLIERVGVVQAALAAAICEARAAADAMLAEAAARMRLVRGDAIDLLAGMAPHTVLLDPMHPERGNSALVKLPMRQLRAAVGDDEDKAALIAAALAAASHRVVLKWPAKVPLPRGVPVPGYSIGGRTTRFDVFVR